MMSPTKSSISSAGGRSSGRLAAPDATTGGSHSIKSSPKLHSLPLETTPIGLLAELSLADNKEKEKEAQSKGHPRSSSKSRSASGAEESGESHLGAGDSSAGGGGEEDDGAIGVASRGYFQPAPASNAGLSPNVLERRNIPEIMGSGLISPEEVDKLFKIYFDRLNVRWISPCPPPPDTYLSPPPPFFFYRCLYPSWTPSCTRLRRHLDGVLFFSQLVRRLLVGLMVILILTPRPQFVRSPPVITQSAPSSTVLRCTSPGKRQHPR
jgi:hypothetical protein